MNTSFSVFNMELLKFVLLLVFMFSVCDAAALPSCSWTHSRLKTLNEESNRLLESMGAPMPMECLEAKKPFPSFPKDVFVKAQNEDLVLVALETLRGVATIFKNNQTSVTWDREKLGLFKNIVNRQVEKLEKCVGKEVQTVTEKPADSSTATLRSYFEKLEERLKEKGFSSCAWEIVRTELREGLKKFQTFLQSRK
ncbi:interferon alpha-4-like [Pangasianodon hypophthalmus]|uniref:interferon alpha-4-like n=1 Tax=Pangasianodon hypophthalmus TaxID=310915 RepID=UPI0023072DF3|nr:interferon alpha-4-like [Pangasianodon hypophthalmus]